MSAEIKDNNEDSRLNEVLLKIGALNENPITSLSEMKERYGDDFNMVVQVVRENLDIWSSLDDFEITMAVQFDIPLNQVKKLRQFLENLDISAEQQEQIDVILQNGKSDAEFTQMKETPKYLFARFELFEFMRRTGSTTQQVSSGIKKAKSNPNTGIVGTEGLENESMTSKKSVEFHRKMCVDMLKINPQLGTRLQILDYAKRMFGRFKGVYSEGNILDGVLKTDLSYQIMWLIVFGESMRNTVPKGITMDAINGLLFLLNNRDDVAADEWMLEYYGDQLRHNIPVFSLSSEDGKYNKKWVVKER